MYIVNTNFPQCTRTRDKRCRVQSLEIRDVMLWIKTALIMADGRVLCVVSPAQRVTSHKTPVTSPSGHVQQCPATAVSVGRGKSLQLTRGRQSAGRRSTWSRRRLQRRLFSAHKGWNRRRGHKLHAQLTARPRNAVATNSDAQKVTSR